MASATNRSLRSSPRTLGPLRPQENGNPPRKSNQSQLQRMSLAGGDGWAEPPLRAPQPSFMDYNLERFGVLEQMMALGTLPTAKVKAKAKSNPMKKVVQARNLEGMVVDDTPVTPELTATPPQELNAAPTSFEVASRGGSSGGALIDHQMQMVDARVVAPVQPLATSAPVLRSHSTRQSTSLASTISPTDVLEEGLAKAVRQAIQNRDFAVEQNLMHLHVATMQDPEFALLLKFAMTNDSLEERGSAVNRKLKQLRKDLRTNTFQYIKSPKGTSSGSAMQLSTQNKATAARSHNTPTPSTSRHSSPALLPSHTMPVDMDTNLHESTSPPPIKKQNSGGQLSRRSSSSSLSSIDEGLVATPPPTLKLNLGKPQTVHRQAPVDSDEAEIDARRKRLRRDFDDVKVADSNVRPSLVLNFTRRHSSTPTAKAKPEAKTETKAEIFDETSPLHNPLTPMTETFGASLGGLKRPATPVESGRPLKRIRATPKIKMSPQKPQHQPAIAGITKQDRGRRGSVGFDDNISEQSENNDYCSTCSGPGYLLCCDGCDRAFHFTCLDPPLDPNAMLSGSWLCHVCHSEREGEEKSELGLFADLQKRLARKNPSSFHLPHWIRDYFEGVQTGENGEYVDMSNQKLLPVRAGRIIYDDPPDHHKLKDSKGNSIMCYHCGKSSLAGQSIIACDHCSTSWHLDCLTPPLANAPNRYPVNGKTRPLWMCPLHVDHDLKHLDTEEQDRQGPNRVGHTHKVRRPKSVKIVEPALRRGFVNNGLIEIAYEPSDDELEWEEEEQPDGLVYRLPAEGIKLDFIDRVKSKRIFTAQSEHSRAVDLELRNARLAYINQRKLSRDLTQRRIKEQVAALNMVRLATDNAKLNVGMDELENLLLTLEAEAPAEVLDALTESEAVASRPSAPSRERPPSPPASFDQVEGSKAKQLSDRERQLLVMLQKHIAMRLRQAIAED